MVVYVDAARSNAHLDGMQSPYNFPSAASHSDYKTPSAFSALADNAIAALHAKAERMTRSLMRHRDRYLKAWLACTGLSPTDAVMVERQSFDRDTGSVVLTIEIVSKSEATRRFRT